MNKSNESLFSRTILLRGTELYQKNCVSITRIEKNYIEAKVDDHETCFVTITFDNKHTMIHSDCSNHYCFGNCKHIAAALLAYDDSVQETQQDKINSLDDEQYIKIISYLKIKLNRLLSKKYLDKTALNSIYRYFDLNFHNQVNERLYGIICAYIINYFVKDVSPYNMYSYVLHDLIDTIFDWNLNENQYISMIKSLLDYNSICNSQIMTSLLAKLNDYENICEPLEYICKKSISNSYVNLGLSYIHKELPLKIILEINQNNGIIIGDINSTIYNINENDKQIFEKIISSNLLASINLNGLKHLFKLCANNDFKNMAMQIAIESLKYNSILLLDQLVNNKQWNISYEDISNNILNNEYEDLLNLYFKNKYKKSILNKLDFDSFIIIKKLIPQAKLKDLYSILLNRITNLIMKSEFDDSVIAALNALKEINQSLLNTYISSQEFINREDKLIELKIWKINYLFETNALNNDIFLYQKEK